MSASAGRVLLLFKGVYDGSATYEPMDVVEYGVSSYVCKEETTGNIPTNTAYWQVLAKGISNMSPEAIGIGYGVSSDTGSSRTAALTDYNLTPNGIVAVSFASDVPANATLNINSQGAKAIYYRGSALVANVIRGGDTVTFGYDGTRYNVLCIDGGAGHEIENSAGTKLTQRDVMQVLDGLEAVDDSTNQKTKIKMNLPIVSSADWNAMTEQEKTAYKAAHYRFGVEVPDTEGVINAEYMKLLWENPNTTQAFAAQTVTLNSVDYDFLMLISELSTQYSQRIGTIIIEKGENAYIEGVVTGTARLTAQRRMFNYVSATSYSFEDAYKIDAGGSQAIDNSLCIPIAIYGIKKNFQFKVNAIATDLSTSADHCFLSDNETSVEDKFEEITEQIGLKILKKTTSVVPTANSGVTPFSYYASGNFGLPAGATIVAMLVTPYGGSAQRTIVNKMPNQADGFYLYSTSNETVGVSCLYTV